MRGEPIGPAHQAALERLLGDPRVGRTLGGVQAPEQVREGIARMQAHWRDEGFGWWMFFDRATGEPVARGGLSRKTVEGRPEVEVAWTVAPARWGEGLASELGAASLEVGFGPLGLATIVSFTLPCNLASRRVMEKLGMRYERAIVHAGLPHVLYRTASTAIVRRVISRP